MNLKPYTYVVKYNDPLNSNFTLWIDGVTPLAALAELERQLKEVYIWVEYIKKNVQLYVVNPDCKLCYAGQFYNTGDKRE